MKLTESQLRQIIREEINELHASDMHSFTVRFITNGAVQEERNITAANLHQLLQEIISIQTSWEEKFKRGIDEPDEWEDEWITYGEVIAIDGKTDPILLSRINIQLENMEENIKSRWQE